MTTFDPMTTLDPSICLDYTLDHTTTAEQLEDGAGLSGTDALAGQLLDGISDSLTAQQAIDALDEVETTSTLSRSNIALPAPSGSASAVASLELTVTLQPLIGTGSILQAVLQVEDGSHSSRVALPVGHPLALRAASTAHGDEITWRPRPRD